MLYYYYYYDLHSSTWSLCKSTNRNEKSLQSSFNSSSFSLTRHQQFASSTRNLQEKNTFKLFREVKYHFLMRNLINALM